MESVPLESVPLESVSLERVPQKDRETTITTITETAKTKRITTTTAEKGMIAINLHRITTMTIVQISRI